MTEQARRRRTSTEQLVVWGLMTAVIVFVVWQMYPSLILRDTTPVQGDLGGHVHEPAHLRDHLLPAGRLSGWSQDWFTGYPSLTFYFPLTSLLIVLLDLLLPYNVALKLVSASGPLALPLCAYAFGRLTRRDRLTSVCYGVAVLPLLLLPTLTVAGGSIASSTSGEYAYGISLALGLVVLGLTRGGLTTGPRRVATAILLAATVLLHLVPALMVVVGMAASVALRRTWDLVRRTGVVLAVAGALVGFWAVPFLLRAKYTAGPDYPKSGPLVEWLFPPVMLPVVLAAALGVVATFMRESGEQAERRDDHGLFLITMTVLSGVTFAVTPAGRLWNGRFLGIWFLWLCLVAGNEVARLARAFDESRRRRARGKDVPRATLVRLAMPVAVFAAVVLMWDSRSSSGFLTAARFDPRTPERSYTGFERDPNRDMYQAFVDALRIVGRDHGCGRVHAAWSKGGFVDERLPAVWLVPYWTDGCLTITQGLYSQSSATFPYVDAANSRLSSSPVFFGAQRPFDLAAGVADLRLLGVRYLLASEPDTVQAADALPELRPLPPTTSDRPWPWRFYEISDVQVVESLRYAPVVVNGIGGTRSTWEAAAGRWFDGGDAREVLVAANGPDTWVRRDRMSTELPRRPVLSATVSQVRIEQDRVSFRVSRTGVPVLVKVSYFPNWQASGAEGPWRVTPNQMVVVPTSKTVTLRYGRTGVDHAGWLVTVAGIGGVVLMARRERRENP